MNRKKDYDEAREHLMLLQDMLFELHNQAQELRQKRTINSNSMRQAPIHSLVLALQAGRTIGGILQAIEQSVALHGKGGAK